MRHKKEERSSLDDDLKLIYGNHEHGRRETNFARLQHARRRGASRPLLSILALLVLLAGAAFAFYFIVGNPFKATQAEAIELTIDGPEEVKSGEEVRYDIRYANKGRLPVAALELQVILPQGWHTTSIEPAPTNEDDEWTIGSVSPGSDDAIVLTGVWIDAVPSAQTIQVMSRYRPSNFNADFEAIATKSVSLTSSTVTIASEAEDHLTVGEVGTYLFRVKNEGVASVENIRLRLTIPESFTIQEASPLPPDSGVEWIISSLEADATFEVNVSGSFASDAVGLQELKGLVGLMRDISFLEQGSTSAQTDVEEAPVKLTMIANGSTADQAIDEGDTLRVSLTTETEVEEGTLELFVESENELPINWDEADLDTGTRDKETIRWDKVTDVDLALPIQGTGSFTLTAQVTVGELVIRSSPLHVSVNSNVSLLSEAHYEIDGQTVGSGPLPPQVAEKTTYRIVWGVTNSGHAIEDVVIKASVPTRATFVAVQNASKGTLTYDETSRSVVWNMDGLDSEDAVSVTFDISVTPEGADIGSYLRLLGETRLTATDTETNGAVSRTADALNTDIDDPGAEEKGVVGE